MSDDLGGGARGPVGHSVAWYVDGTGLAEMACSVGCGPLQDEIEYSSSKTKAAGARS